MRRFNINQLPTSSYSITGSFTGSFTGSLFGTASWAINAQTASYVLPLNQDVLISGSLKFDPTQDPDPSGLDLDSTILFQSASNTSLGYDLYIRQDGNLIKWKWVEGVMNTGLLYGGVVTYSGSNVFVSPGSGIIVNHNAATGSEISPIVEYVTWNAITQSVTNIATQQVTYLYIDNSGTLQQQSTRFTNEQYHDYIPLGAVGHFDYTQVSAFGGQVQTAYDQVAQISSFVDAFGPLKISGYGITGQPGTLRLSVGSGTSFIHGGFYEEDPELPSQITTPAQATASIAYVYRSGSGVRFDTNGGNLYTQLKPGFYDPGTGVTSSVSNNDWTIQRVYSDPKTGILYVYFGQTIYPDFLTAVADLSTDPFTEGDTFDFTTFIGFLVLKSNGNDITAADNKIVPAGLFRGSGQGSGGGVAISNLDDLTDVSITGPTNGEALIYDSGIWQNGVPTSASYALTASYVNPLSQNVIISGSLSSTGSVSITSNSGSFEVTTDLGQYSRGYIYAVDEEVAMGTSYGSFLLNPTSRAVRITGDSAAIWFDPTGDTGGSGIAFASTTASIAIRAGRIKMLGAGSTASGRITSVEITGSLNVSGSATVLRTPTTITGSLTVTGGITGSFTGSYVGDGSGLTGVEPFPFTGSAEITGSLGVTGSISSTALAGSDNRIVLADPQGTLDSSNQTLIEAYINPTSSAALLLDDTNNWTIYGAYTGSSITGTFQGQRHYNIDYFFEAVDDNDWIRLIRG